MVSVDKHFGIYRFVINFLMNRVFEFPFESINAKTFIASLKSVTQ